MSATADRIRTLAAEGHSAPEIADRLNINTQWVYSCAKLHGIALPRHRWPEAVSEDVLRTWKGTDSDLALSLGVTRQAVSLARRRLNKGWPTATVRRGIIAEVTRRAGADADDAARLEAMRAVMRDLNVWADGAEVMP